MRRFWTIASGIACIAVIFAVALGLAIWLLRLSVGPASAGLPTSNLSSTTDVLTIWMSLLGVMIGLASLVVTGVGLFVGALAIFGYQTFREEVQRTVGEAAQTKVSEYLSGKAFDVRLSDVVKSHFVPRSRESGTATTGSPPLGELPLKRYPKKGKAKHEPDDGPHNG